MEWTSTWVNSGRWWGTGRLGVLQSMGSWRAGHDWETEQQQVPGHTDKYRDVVLLTLQVKDHLHRSTSTFPLSPHFLPSTTSSFSSTRGEFVCFSFFLWMESHALTEHVLSTSLAPPVFFFVPVSQAFCSMKASMKAFYSLLCFLSLHLSLKAINKHRIPSCLFGVESCTKTLKEDNTG